VETISTRRGIKALYSMLMPFGRGKGNGLAANSSHAFEHFFDGGEVLFLILFGDPVGDCQHLTVAALGERKADGGRTPLLAFAAPGGAFPFEVGSLEFLLLL
jgi:hypothetical protein